MPAQPSHSPSPSTRLDTIVFDLDGTLVDSTYAHVLAWQEAFSEMGLRVPAHRLHRCIGMGGDRLVTEVAGSTVESSVGDALRARHPELLGRYGSLIVPTDGAAELLEELSHRPTGAVVASSSNPQMTEWLLEALEDAARHLDEIVTGGDTEQTKPDGEPVARALERIGTGHGVMVGDAVWDVRSAQDAGVPCIGVRTGGLAACELYDAGAIDVVDSPATLLERLRATGTVLPGGDDDGA